MGFIWISGSQYQRQGRQQQHRGGQGKCRQQEQANHYSNSPHKSVEPETFYQGIIALAKFV